MTEVLLVEDDASVREALEQTLELADLSVTAMGSFVAAKDRITRSLPGVILSDVRMPGRDGFHLLQYARGVDADLPVILLTGEGDVPSAVRGISEGAFAFLEKPCDPTELVEVLRRALHLRVATLAARQARGALEAGDAAARLLFGVSPEAGALRDTVRMVARGGGAVLIHGEPGTGTSKVAEVVHLLSPRSAGPFVKRAAPALDEASLAQALARAQGGSLFLDKIEALPRDLQYALAEVPDGPEAARLLAATHGPPDALLSSLDVDLYYRLEALRVRIPSLKERPSDIPVLFRHYLAQACEQADLPLPDVPPDVQARLMARDWPGNARSLMNHAMRYAMGIEQEVPRATAGLADRMRAVERAILVETLTRHHGAATAAARDLDLPRKTFYDKLTRHGLRAEDYRSS
ncbi:Fis family transcriptional regulator [Jannaschia pagri]|uniref:Fis family transcriptional regulator n=1 Tax=Jannaschia pagri TaxID=2829797 RepID=A0ABQ4NPR8_9RHOB|nr:MULTISPECIES: sigma-54 dependent transcriptional regulator [unclassified Jannaschia]GIT92435.1 Fis family transcriptional regulator [Jannaschia sp. AI_61]GIT96270.1 Fis family transcriptional regulator [Jannaschia sp. AI_62]